MALSPDQIAKGGSEHAEQSAVFQWAALNINRYPQLKWLHAIPNGFFSSAAQKAKMKAEGLKSGVPDICLPYPTYNGEWQTGYHGLMIEMKIQKYRNHANGGCSDEQLEWTDYLRSAGYRVEVCYSWQEAVKVIEEYLS